MMTLTIGRDDACDIVVDDRSVSRYHAELEECDDGGYRLVDLNSMNGTFVLVGRRFVRATQAVVGVDDKVKLSTVQATVRELLALAETKETQIASSQRVDRTAAIEPSMSVRSGVEKELVGAVDHQWPTHYTFGLVAFFNATAWAGIAVALTQVF